MDAEREQRILTQDELIFRRYLKEKSSSLATIIRSRAHGSTRDLLGLEMETLAQDFSCCMQATEDVSCSSHHLN
jgi:hypothetical protein